MSGGSDHSNMMFTLAAGTDHTLVVNQGNVWSFGDNTYGQLGDPQRQLKPTQLTTFNSNMVKQVACGEYYSLVLTTNNNVYSFGNNQYCQLGHDIETATPTRIIKLLTPKVIQIACGRSHSLVLTQEGKVYSFGFYTVTGLDTIYTGKIPTIINNIQQVKQVACGQLHSLLLTNDGNVYSFGIGKFGNLGYKLPDIYQDVQLLSKLIDHLSNKIVTQVACGGLHSFVQTNNNEIIGFGNGIHGQLGLGSDNIHETNMPTKINFVFTGLPYQIACGYFHTLILTTAGKVYSFGSNIYGQLGLNDQIIRYLPVLIPRLSKVTEITCGNKYSIVKTNNQILSFGQQINGNLGYIQNEDQLIPMSIPTFNLLKDINRQRIDYNFLNYLPSCIILQSNEINYHLSHGGCDHRLMRETNKDFEKFVNSKKPMIGVVNNNYDNKKDTEYLVVIEHIYQLLNNHGIDVIQNNTIQTDLEWNDFIDPFDSNDNLKMVGFNEKSGFIFNKNRSIGYQILLSKVSDKYLIPYSINKIISGHQDNVNYNQYPKSNNCQNQSVSQPGFYQNNSNLINSDNNIQEINNNTEVIITSTATYSKYNEYLRNHCYLELSPNLFLKSIENTENLQITQYYKINNNNCIPKQRFEYNYEDNRAFIIKKEDLTKLTNHYSLKKLTNHYSLNNLLYTHQDKQWNCNKLWVNFMKCDTCHNIQTIIIDSENHKLLNDIFNNTNDNKDRTILEAIKIIKNINFSYHRQTYYDDDRIMDSGINKKIFDETTINNIFDEVQTKYIEQLNNKDIQYVVNDINISYFKREPVKFTTIVHHIYYQKVCIYPEKVCIIGDIHSSLSSLCEILLDLKKKKYFKENISKLKDDYYIFFLGDLVDRGPYSIEILCIVFKLKLLNWDNIHIIRGNHENEEQYNHYGLMIESQVEYPSIISLSSELNNEITKISTDNFSQDNKIIFNRIHENIRTSINNMISNPTSTKFVYTYLDNVDTIIIVLQDHSDLIDIIQNIIQTYNKMIQIYNKSILHDSQYRIRKGYREWSNKNEPTV